MNTYYTLPNGRKISLYYWSDFAKNETFREFVDIRVLKPDGYFEANAHPHRIHKDEGGIYFDYKGNKTYINNYDYLSDEEIIDYAEKILGNNGDYMFQDMLLATLLRGGEKLGFVMKSNLYDIRTAFGFCLPSSETVTALFVPCENKLYTKEDWHYKISFKPIVKDIVTPATYYFSDFVSLIKEGFIKVVNKEEYIKEKKEWAKQYKLSLKKKKLFRKKKELSLQDAVDLITYLEKEES